MVVEIIDVVKYNGEHVWIDVVTTITYKEESYFITRIASTNSPYSILPEWSVSSELNTCYTSLPSQITHNPLSHFLLDLDKFVKLNASAVVGIVLHKQLIADLNRKLETKILESQA